MCHEDGVTGPQRLCRVVGGFFAAPGEGAQDLNRRQPTGNLSPCLWAGADPHWGRPTDGWERWPSG